MTTPAADPRAEDTRRRLVAAGVELFGRYGFDAVTTRQLAEAAGANQAAIPYHFGGKEGVYRAVAEHIASVSGARIGPILAAVRERLATEPDRRVVGEILLETTLAIARATFEPAYRTVWLTFLTREQFHPSAAFERLYEEFAGPVHGLLGELIGRLTGAPADAPDTILLAHAYLGQIIGFASARATLNRRLGREGEFGAGEVAAVIAAIARFSRMAIKGMDGAAKR